MQIPVECGRKIVFSCEYRTSSIIKDYDIIVTKNILLFVYFRKIKWHLHISGMISPRVQFRCLYTVANLKIQVFLHATTSKKQAMQLKMRNIEWWMRRRHLPTAFKQRVRNYERQRWAAMRGVDECEMIRNLPEGLRRDIKYHLCLDLVRQVKMKTLYPWPFVNSHYALII